jgi:hypothetical protein
MTTTLSLLVVFGILWSALVVGLCVISLVAVELACVAIERVKRSRRSRHSEQGDAPGRAAQNDLLRSSIAGGALHVVTPSATDAGARSKYNPIISGTRLGGYAKLHKTRRARTAIGPGPDRPSQKGAPHGLHCPVQAVAPSTLRSLLPDTTSARAFRCAES